MNNTVKNILYILLGFFIAAIINVILMLIMFYVIPQPMSELVFKNPHNFDSAMKLYEIKKHIFIVFSNMLSTFLGVFITVSLSLTNKLLNAITESILHLLFWLFLLTSYQSPSWFIILDFTVPFLTMAFLGYKLAYKKSLPQPLPRREIIEAKE